MIKKPLIIITIILLLTITVIMTIPDKKDYDFNIHFFNVGKADSMLIRYKDKYILIDTALESENVVNYLKKNNISTIDYLIITHFDKDHVGGAYDIISSFNINNVLQSNYPKDSDYYNNYILALNNKKITPIIIENDKTFYLNDLSFNVNGPNKIYDKNESNNSSLIVSIKYNNNSFLFTGDIENERIEDYISINNDTYDFIKIPHHGNYHKNLDLLLENTKPKYAVISSDSEEYKMINIISKLNIKYYHTKNGDIDVYSDGNIIYIKQ